MFLEFGSGNREAEPGRIQPWRGRQNGLVIRKGPGARVPDAPFAGLR